ncbi:MAG TPA: hypothetical protein VNE86_06175 [Nitrososphaerales archaeon]|nr:hypothetical protein [Nitrososphaerales archaeon]
MTPIRSLSMVVATMLLIQIALGAATVFLNLPVISHLALGVLSFVALLALVYLVVKQFGTKSKPFRYSIIAVVDFIIQGILGFVSLNSSVALIVHLANAIILMVIVVMLIRTIARTPPPVKKVIAAATP